MADTSAINARLASYRPVFNRLLFGIALVGVLVAVHLLIQQGRGFDRGCLGFSAPAAVESTFDCQLVTESRAGTLLGVSNAWWGLGFYLAVAGLSAAVAFASRAARRFRWALVRAVLIGGGLVYSGYLTYHQFAGLGALCALCLTSAAVATLLFLVQAVMLARPVAAAPGAARSSERSSSSSTASDMPSASRPRPALWAGAALALLVLVGADLLYFSSLEPAAQATPSTAATSAPPPSPGQAPAGQAPASEASPSASADAPAPGPAAAGRADTTETSLPPGCRFAPAQEPVEPSRLVGFTDPIFGADNAPVTVVEFFDPNCPHCKTFDATMERLVDQYGDQARFVYKPIPLWRYSVNQITALHAAARQGKFRDMLDAQFARQQQGGLSDDQLVEIARQIGMNPNALQSQLSENAYQKQIARDRQLAQEVGVSGTPAVAINGQLVARRARTAQCVTALLEREIQQASPQAGS